MARRESIVDGKPGQVFIGRHMTDGAPSGHYVISSTVKQTVEHRIKYENAKFPATELIASFEVSDAGAAERQSRARLCDVTTGMVRGYPDKRKPPSHSEWLYNEDEREEALLVKTVKETCEEFAPA